MAENDILSQFSNLQNTGMLSSVESLQKENKELKRIINDVSQLISLTKVDSMLDVAEKAILALEIAEFTTLENQSEVQNYAIEIAENFKKYSKEVDGEIQKYSNGWDISRLVKMDKDILRIAITELLYVKGAPLKVVVDEAVELAKKYSTEDSSSFVNGILAKVILENGLK